MPEKKTRQPNNFDSLRLLFAVLVVFSHSFPIARSTNDTEPLFVLTHGQATFGNISVWAFFLISGFLITRSWQRSPSILKYLKHRVGRIYPGFAAATIVAAVVFIPLATYTPIHLAVSLKELLFSCLWLQDLHYAPIFPNNPLHDALNGSLWSVSFEARCYLGVIFLGLTGLLRKRWIVVALFFIVLGLRLYTDVTGWIPGTGPLPSFVGFPLFWFAVLPFFLAGTIFQISGGPALLRRPWLALAAALLVASNFVPHGLVVTMPICGSYLLMGLAYLPLLHPIRLGRFGDFSYGTYLYAFPIQQLIAQRSHGHISPWLLFLEAAPLAVGAGVLSHFLVERHFISRGSQLKQEGLVPDERKTPSGAPRIDKVDIYPPTASSAPVAYASVGNIDLTTGESNATSKV